MAHIDQAKKQAKAEYDRKYQREQIERVTIWLNKEKDKDIIDFINEQGEQKSTLIKSCIRGEIAYREEWRKNLAKRNSK